MVALFTLGSGAVKVRYVMPPMVWVMPAEAPTPAPVIASGKQPLSPTTPLARMAAMHFVFIPTFPPGE
jgi:hypothetical protein